MQIVAIAAAVVVILLVLLIPGYGYWRDVLHVGAEPLVTVGDQTITSEDYARYLGTRQEILARQIGQAQAAIPTPVATPTAAATSKATPTPSADEQAAQQTLQTLSSEESSLSTIGLTDLVESHLILDQATARHLTVSQTEMDNALRWLMSPPAPGLQQEYGLAAAPANPTGANLLTTAQAKQALTQLVGQGRYLSAAQIDELILKPAVLKTKLIAALSQNIPTTSDQVHARHILVKTEAEAKSIRQKLVNGGNFAALAKQYSIDTGTKDKGGDLGWFGKGVMDPAFEKAAFSLKVGEISQPVKSSFGYHIIEVLAKDPHHKLSPEQLQQARDQAYQTWLSDQESNGKQVNYQLSSVKMTWVQSYIQKGNG